jgi:hypothetical protein
LISVEIVGCCNRLITSFNGAFFTIIVDDDGGVIGTDGRRIIEDEFDFCLQLDDSSSSSSLSISHRLLSSSLNNG